MVVLSSVCALGVDNNQRNMGHRAIIFVICVFGAFVYWSYCAVLVSYLTVMDDALPINTVEDILRKTGYCVILRKSSVTTEYFDEADLDTNAVAYNILKQGLRNVCYTCKYSSILKSLFKVII